MSLFGGGGDDKYTDRAWDWAKKVSNQVAPGWYDIFNQSLNPTQSGQMSPWGQQSMDYAENAMAPYSGDFTQSNAWKTISGLYGDVGQDPFESDLYTGAEELYQPTVDPLYAQLMDPLKRGIEGQYRNATDQMLASGVRGGSLTDALATAAMNRSTSLGDMERTLRAQDIQRLDANQLNRANALTSLAQNIYQAQNANKGILGQSALNLNNQGLMANMQLMSLLNQINTGDIDRATNMGNLGMQGRYMTGQNLASSEGSQNAGMMGGLLNMGSLLGMGLGQSGAGSNMFSGLGSLFGGGGDAGPELLNTFG